AAACRSPGAAPSRHRRAHRLHQPRAVLMRPELAPAPAGLTPASGEAMPRPHLLLSRRAAAALIAFPAAWTGVRAQPPAPRRPTPAQTEGPFYPVALPE